MNFSDIKSNIQITNPKENIWVVKIIKRINYFEDFLKYCKSNKAKYSKELDGLVFQYNPIDVLSKFERKENKMGRPKGSPTKKKKGRPKKSNNPKVEPKEAELNKIFKHHAWFVGEKKTKKEAMDYFAKSGDFWLSAKPSKEQSDNLLDPMNYDDILKSGKQTYRLSPIEKEYFLERKEYWKGETEKQNKEFLSESINADEEFKKDLSGNSYVSHRDYNKAKEQYSEPYLSKTVAVCKENYKTITSLFDKEKNNNKIFLLKIFHHPLQ